MMRYILYLGTNIKRQSDNCVFETDSTLPYQMIVNPGHQIRIIKDVAPFPIELDTSVKVQFSDEETFEYYKNFCNYCVIQGVDNDKLLGYYYYYITNIERLSNSVALLSLSMDTLNTFRGGIVRALQDDRTFVYREHCDRFTKYNPNQNWYYPIVDYIDEGFTLKQYKRSDETIEDLYFNDSQINCFLIINSKEYPQHYPSWQPGQVPDLWHNDQMIDYGRTNEGYYSNKVLNVGILFDKNVFGERMENGTRITMDFQYFKKGNVYVREADTDKRLWYDGMSYYCQLNGCTPIKDVDLAVESVVKVKALPYTPTPCTMITLQNKEYARFDESGPTYDLVRWPLDPYEDSIQPENYSHGIAMYYNTAKSGFYKFPKRTIRTETAMDYTLTYTDARWLNTTALRFVRDPKTYNSNFYTLKFVYAETYYALKLENCDIPHGTSASALHRNLPITINYQVSYSLSADFMVEIIPTYGWKYKESDYDGVFVVSDACEVSLINDEYINYMRVGYNYDQQAHTNQMAKTVLSSVVAVASATAIGGMQGGVPGAVVGGSIALASSIINIGFTEASYHNSVDKKKAELSNQSPQLSNSKNGELLIDTYKNRVRKLVYEPKPEEYTKLQRLFHLYGYQRNLYKSVDTHTRYWFNYVQCEPYLDNEIPSFAVEDVRERLKSGVTFFHPHDEIASSGYYDFKQQYENWEVSLL